MKSVAAATAAAAVAVLSLGADACVPPNCDRVDFGSCGNACCQVRVNHPDNDSVTVKTLIEKNLLSGGVDHRYALQTTAESPNVKGFADLRPFNVPAQFQGFTTHTTLSGKFTDNVCASTGIHPCRCVLF